MKQKLFGPMSGGRRMKHMLKRTLWLYSWGSVMIWHVEGKMDSFLYIRKS